MKKIIGLMSGIGLGGAEIQSILLFNGLCQNGFSVKVLVLSNKMVQLADRLDKNIEAVFINRKTYFDTAAILQVKKNITETNPDYLIMVDSYPVLYGFILNRVFRMKLKNIIIIHNTIPPTLKCAVQNRLVYGPSINRLDRVVFVCKSQMNYWTDKYHINGKKAAVIFHGIDIGYFSQFCQCNDKYKWREQLNIPVDAYVIAMNASLRPEKSHEHMVEAVEQLRKEGMDLFLLIIGDGPRRKYLEELSARKGISDYVMITGFVKDVRPYLMCADISVLTSTAVETLSMAAIESMTMGKPMILSNIGGAPEMVDNSVNGYLYTPGNIKELMECIRKIFKKGNYLRMGEAAKEKAGRLFSQERMIREYLRLLSENWQEDADALCGND
jgi:glycosyltransferase involved in cell wall biosynthesis